jgi:membrane protein implicated in regulation of membrane protease activity
MKLTGFLLLLGGWIIVLAAIALLPSGPSQVSFVLVALGVEVLGLTLVFRAHLIPSRERR